MKNPTSKVFDQAWTMFKANKGNEAIQEATGLNYSQMWCDRTRRLIEAGEPVEGGQFTGKTTFIKTDGVSNTALGAAFAKARLELQSWGLIGVRARMPESRARKIFAEATGIDSKGLRNGRGGRHVADDPRFYTGSDRAKGGTELVPTVPVLDQVPDTDSEQVRNLPKVVAKLTKPKTVRKPKAPKAEVTPTA